MEQNVLQPGGAAKVRHRPGPRPCAAGARPLRQGPAWEPAARPSPRPCPPRRPRSGLAPSPLPQPLLSCAALAAAPAPGPRPAGNFSPLQRGRSFPPQAVSRARGKLLLTEGGPGLPCAAASPCPRCSSPGLGPGRLGSRLGVVGGGAAGPGAALGAAGQRGRRDRGCGSPPPPVWVLPLSAPRLGRDSPLPGLPRRRGPGRSGLLH